MTVYMQMKPLVLRRLKSYIEDFTKHDRQWLRDNPGVPFLHVTHDLHTHIVPLYPADHEVWPAEGQYVPYLFGSADRWHILKDGTGLILTIDNGHREPHDYLYFNGKSLRTVTAERARDIRNEYVASVTSQWKRPRQVA